MINWLNKPKVISILHSVKTGYYSILEHFRRRISIIIEGIRLFSQQDSICQFSTQEKGWKA